MRKTKIVCTLGPATDDENEIKKLVKCGMNCARLNLSHGTFEEHKQKADIIKKIRKELGVPIAIMLDNKGPEIRIKKFENGKIFLKPKAIFVLTTRDVLGNEKEVAVSLATFPNLIVPKTKILINDGLIELVCISKTETDVVCKVVHGGVLSNNKSINLPDVDTNWDYLKDSDTKELDLAVKLDADFLALSFVSMPKDVVDVREYLKRRKGGNIKLIAKIESAKGVENIDEILEVCDGVMVARGDLGVEVEFSKIPAIQKEILAKAKKMGKISITATQMLESMIENPRPTRAEISDVANAVLDGTGAVMLSGETAAGKYPFEAVETMVDIVKETEKNVNYEANFLKLNNKTSNVFESIAYATVCTSFSAKCNAIVVATQTGLTAIRISAYMPKCEIVACSPDEKVFNQLALCFGVVSVLTSNVETSEQLFVIGKKRAIEEGFVEKGDMIVLTAGVPSKSKATNQMKIEIV